MNLKKEKGIEEEHTEVFGMCKNHCRVPVAPKKATDQLSNPNLLINGDFQVWQRGETFSKNGYCADRWKLSISAGNVAIIKKIDTGLRITETTESLEGNQLDYYMETFDTKHLSKKTLTLNISKNGSVKTLIRIKNGSNYTVLAETLANKLTVEIPKYIEGDLLNVCLRAYQNVDIQWIKLEIGDKETPFIPRNYTEELEMCKRYFEKKLVTGNHNAIEQLTTGYILCEFSLIAKRVKPTFSSSDSDGNIGFCERISYSAKRQKQKYRIYAEYNVKENLTTYELISDSGDPGCTCRGLITADAEIY